MLPTRAGSRIDTPSDRGGNCLGRTPITSSIGDR